MTVPGSKTDPRLNTNPHGPSMWVLEKQREMEMGMGMELAKGMAMAMELEKENKDTQVKWDL